MHTPRLPPPAQQPVGLPVYRSAAFVFETAEEYADILGDRKPGYSYSRIDNPTTDNFAKAVAALESVNVDAEIEGQPFASGMAAISAVVLSLTKAGAHVIAPCEVYGGTYELLTRVMPKFDVATSFVETSDLDAVRAAVRDETCVILSETLANPTMSVANLPELASIAHAAGVPLVVDSTFATPAICRPLEWGADLVVHSATKYIGGHGDATGGVVVAAPELARATRAIRSAVGGALGPDEAFLLHRGLATLPLRVERHCVNALALAQAIAGHPAVTQVHFPGLPTHRDHSLAGKLFDTGPSGTRYGGIVTVEVAGGRDGGLRLCNALRITHIASSLGGVQTKVSHVASTTHRQLDDAAIAAAGLDPSAVRVSLGLEDVDDIIADFTQALDQVN